MNRVQPRLRSPNDISTRVLFPRFQTETNPELDILHRKVVEAPSLAWLSTLAVTALVDAPTFQALGPSVNERANWWGVYHWTREACTPERYIAAPEGETEVFRLRRLIHEYLWDQQACSGGATELVLECWDPLGEQFNEELALLVSSGLGRIMHNRDNQQLTVSTDNDHWSNPSFTPFNFQTSFELAVLLELAKPEVAVNVS